MALLAGGEKGPKQLFLGVFTILTGLAKGPIRGSKSHFEQGVDMALLTLLPEVLKGPKRAKNSHFGSFWGFGLGTLLTTLAKGPIRGSKSHFEQGVDMARLALLKKGQKG
mgnify:FL=1